MKTSDTIQKISEALVMAQGEWPVIIKDKTVNVPGKFSYMYSDLSTILHAIQPVMLKHGLAFAQCVERWEQGWICKTRLIHKTGEYFETETPLFIRQNDSQGFGSAFTFAKRYGISALISTSSEADTDGDAALKGGSSEQLEGKSTGKDPEPLKPSGKKAPIKPKVSVTPPKAEHIHSAKNDDPLTAMERVELSRWEITDGKLKGKKLGEVHQDELLLFRDNVLKYYAKNPDKIMPLNHLQMIEKIEALYFELF